MEVFWTASHSVLVASQQDFSGKTIQSLPMGTTLLLQIENCCCVVYLEGDYLPLISSLKCFHAFQTVFHSRRFIKVSLLFPSGH